MIIYENEEILKECETNTSIIPNNVLSFSEAACYVMEASEKAYNEMFEEIGISELAVYESTGYQIVYEDGTLKALKDKVVAFFKKMWEAIKGFFENALKFFQQKMKEISIKFAKETPIKKTDLDKLSPNKNFGKIHQFDIKMREYGTNASDFASEVSAEFKKICKDSNKEDRDSKKKELEEKICSKVSGIDGVTNIVSMRKKIEEKMVGSEIPVNSKYIKQNFDQIYGITFKGSSIADIKELYKRSRKYIDNCVTIAKSYTDDRANCMNQEVSVLKSIGSAMNAANAKAIDVYKRRISEYRNVLVKAAIDISRNGSNNESTEIDEKYADQLSMIESAFNF